MLQGAQCAAIREWVDSDVQMPSHPRAELDLRLAYEFARRSDRKPDRLAKARGERAAKRRTTDGAAQVVHAETLAQRHRANAARRPLRGARLARVDTSCAE